MNCEKFLSSCVKTQYSKKADQISSSQNVMLTNSCGPLRNKITCQKIPYQVGISLIKYDGSNFFQLKLRTASIPQLPLLCVDREEVGEDGLSKYTHFRHQTSLSVIGYSADLHMFTASGIIIYRSKRSPLKLKQY